MKTTKQQFWQEHLDDWQASGLSQTDYCNAHQLKLGTFTYWRGKQTTPSTKLIPVNTGPLGQVLISLPGGVQLHIPAAQVAALLPSVLQAVRSVPSC